VAESSDWQHGLQVDLTPVGAHVLFGLSMSALSNRVVALDQILGGAGALLAEQLYEAASWEERFACLDAKLAHRLGAGSEPSPAVAWAWDRLVETGGRLPVRALAEELGSSRQYIVAKFRDQVGLPPKTIARIVRFRRALQLLGREDRSLAALAHECGYYDQAHLNRDFRDFTGGTPTEHLARRLPGGAGVIAR
jgi:AraC-like DNA-binding protein